MKCPKNPLTNRNESTFKTSLLRLPHQQKKAYRTTGATVNNWTDPSNTVHTDSGNGAGGVRTTDQSLAGDSSYESSSVQSQPEHRQLLDSSPTGANNSSYMSSRLTIDEVLPH